METRILKVDPAMPDRETVLAAGRIIREGGLVAFPTETVYGLGGDALLPSASRKIYEAKGRPSDNPLIVHITAFEDLEKIASEVPENAEKLIRTFWPGPLTVILPKTDAVPTETTGGLSTVAVRMPSHPVARAFIEASGGYIAAPSANLSGRPSTTTAAHVWEDLQGRIPLILDGGPAQIGLESTIVDFTEGIPTLLRPGYYSLDMLRDVLGEVRTDPALDGVSTARPKAPGMRYRHYAPKAPLVIVEGDRAAVREKICSLVRENEKAGISCGILCVEDSAAAYKDLAAPVFTAGSLEDEESIARNLFARLRDFDGTGVERIYSEAFDTPHLGGAIMNRLLKAAGHTVVRAGLAGN